MPWALVVNLVEVACAFPVASFWLPGRSLEVSLRFHRRRMRICNDCHAIKQSTLMLGCCDVASLSDLLDGGPRYALDGGRPAVVMFSVKDVWRSVVVDSASRLVPVGRDAPIGWR